MFNAYPGGNSLIIPAELSALVVDDNRLAHVLAQNILKKIGLRDVQCASGVVSALDLARNHRFSFVLLDWYMPEISGAGFVELVRSGLTPLPRDIPIIVSTAYSTRENTARIRDLGIREILVKPLKEQQMGMAISIALKGRPDLLQDDETERVDLDQDGTDRILL